MQDLDEPEQGKHAEPERHHRAEEDADAPTRPTESSARRALLLRKVGKASASRAMSPPSPWLSARMTNSTYLSVTTIMMAQKTSERMPSTASFVAPPADLKHSRSA